MPSCFVLMNIGLFPKKIYFAFPGAISFSFRVDPFDMGGREKHFWQRSLTWKYSHHYKISLPFSSIKRGTSNAKWQICALTEFVQRIYDIHATSHRQRRFIDVGALVKMKTTNKPCSSGHGEMVALRTRLPVLYDRNSSISGQAESRT